MQALRLALAGALALASGTLATMFIAKTLGQQSSEREREPVVWVVAARRVLPAGHVLEESDLHRIKWGAASAPKDAFAQISPLIGRVTRQPLPADDLLFESKLAASDVKAGGLSATISMGKRAISVRVNDVVGVAGFALPGSFVDVLASAKDSSGESFSKIVLERVKVLAAAQDTQADPNKPKVVTAVTLELNPREAETLDLARSIGGLSLVLRNEADTLRAEGRGTRLSDLTASHSTSSHASTLSDLDLRMSAPRGRGAGRSLAPGSAGNAPSGSESVVVQELRGVQIR